MPMRSDRLSSLRNVALFTLMYLGIATYFSFTSGNGEFRYYIAVVVILSGCALAVHLRVGLSQGVIWALSIWALLHMIGGLVPLPAGLPFNGDKAVFYSWWLIQDVLKYDHVLHVYGFGVATWMCFEALRSMLMIRIPTTGSLVAAALMGMGLGAINEVVEFIAVLVIPETNVGGYLNTGWDMVANGVGCVGAAVLIYMRHGKVTSE